MPLPLDGYEEKRIYVWFEAVIGYLSAAVEWASENGHADGWQDYWKNGEARSYYFIGKDNIPFHSIIWPAMLMGYGGLNLPYDVPANEFLSLESRKFSTSQNWAVWVPDYLDRYDPDPLRYLLSINMPETGDTDFSWSEFVRRNNDELVATYGNLVNRVLRFTYRNFDGQVPVDAAAPDDMEHRLLQTARETMTAVDDSLAHTRFRAGRQPSLRTGAGVQPVSGRQGSVAGDQGRPRPRRPLVGNHHPGAQLPQGHAGPVSAVHQPEAARVPRV